MPTSHSPKWVVSGLLFLAAMLSAIVLYQRCSPPIALLKNLVKPYKSQAAQDQWIVEKVYPGQRGGYFVDIGAYDGRTISNTYYLEKELGWKGILIDADAGEIKKCAAARSNPVEHVAISDKKGVARFSPRGQLGKLSTNGTVEVATDTLHNVLLRHGAPRFIHYLSMDIEGGEYDALKNFPFEEYLFGAMSIETSLGNQRIRNLLTSKGYIYVGHVFADDLYVHRSLYKSSHKVHCLHSLIPALLLLGAVAALVVLSRRET